MMHLKLAKLTRQPDALIIYSGHNEFLGRFPVENRVSFYVDEPSFRCSRAWIMRGQNFILIYLGYGDREKMPAKCDSRTVTRNRRKRDRPPGLHGRGSPSSDRRLSPAARGDCIGLHAHWLLADPDHSAGKRRV